MQVPIWLTLGVAALVLIFGAYRIRIAFRTDDEDQRARSKKGLYAMRRRTHFLIGTIYLLLGAGLVATSLGWNPFGSLLGPDTLITPETKPAKPGTIPVDQLPAKKP